MEVCPQYRLLSHLVSLSHSHQARTFISSPDRDVQTVRFLFLFCHSTSNSSLIHPRRDPPHMGNDSQPWRANILPSNLTDFFEGCPPPYQGLPSLGHFVLSGDCASRYRSGVSLTRADSATLPQVDFALLHSPHLRNRTGTGDFPLTPPSPTIPLIPGNWYMCHLKLYVVRRNPAQNIDPVKEIHNSTVFLTLKPIYGQSENRRNQHGKYLQFQTIVLPNHPYPRCSLQVHPNKIIIKSKNRNSLTGTSILPQAKSRRRFLPNHRS